METPKEEVAEPAVAIKRPRPAYLPRHAVGHVEVLTPARPMLIRQDDVQSEAARTRVCLARRFPPRQVKLHAGRLGPVKRA